MCNPHAGVKALDVATGGGHVARRLREQGAEVVTADPAPGMQADVVCAAEDLPFADGSFDVVVTRIAPHHFADIGTAVGEMARVSNRVVVVEDTQYTSEEVEAAEKLRDPTHVRNYSEEEWRELLESAGLEIERVETFAEDARPRGLARAHRVHGRGRRARARAARTAYVRGREDLARHEADRESEEVTEVMAIIVDNDTKLVVQGLTGSEGRFHGLRNRAYGTDLVAGVTPGKGGQDVDGVPVYDTVAEAVREAGANTSMIFVPARFAPDAIYEAVDAGITTVICITEHIPAHEMLRVYTYVRPKGVTLIGPNCPGVLSPGKANVGIIPAEVFQHGKIGLVSRSGTLTYQIGNELAQRGPRQLDDRRHRRRPCRRLELHRHPREVRGRSRDRDDRPRRRDRRRRGGEGRAVRRGPHVEARLLLHRRLLGAARQDDGPRRRDHLRLVGHGAAKKDALEAVGIKVGTTPTEVAELVVAAAA